MKLIIMRHGQTRWNVEHRIQGHTDIPLDERGERQAEAIAERLQALEIDAVYTSPLLRAYKTGEKIALQNHCPIIRDSRLIERFFGLWEGRRMEDVAEEEPEAWAEWVKAPADFSVPEGESMRQVSERTLCAAADIRRLHAGKNVVIVSHANPVKLLLMHYIGIPFNCAHRLRTDNCSYTELRLHKGNMVLATFNETQFLRERGLL